MSGRNISDLCKGKRGWNYLYNLDGERRWAAKLIRKEVVESLPNLE